MQRAAAKVWSVWEGRTSCLIPSADLIARTVRAGEIVAPFEIDDYTRWRLLEGLDDIGLTLRHEEEVTEFEKSRPSHKPVTTLA